MYALMTAVLTSSLLGSTHCAGMCGAFLAAAINVGRPSTKAEKFRQQASYHLGRLITYVALGSLAGLVGSAVQVLGHAAGVQHAAAMTAGTVMIAMGLVAIARHLGVQAPRAPVPKFMQRLLVAAHQRVWDFPPALRALALGLLTTLLPCGWLYAFLIVAAGTGQVLSGGLVMIVFWVGTLPMLATLGVGLQMLTGSLRRWLPLATSAAVVVVGIATIAGRFTIPHGAMLTLAQPHTPGDGSPSALDPANLPCGRRSP